MSDRPPDTNPLAWLLWDLAVDGAPLGALLTAARAETDKSIAAITAFRDVFDLPLSDAISIVGAWEGFGEPGRSADDLEREYGARLRIALRHRPRRMVWTKHADGGWTGVDEDELRTSWQQKMRSAIPQRLRELIAAQRWNDPPREVWLRAVPWYASPDDRVALVTTVDAIASWSAQFAMGFCNGAIHRTSGDGICAEERDNPEWVDATRALVIAISTEIGADLSVVLDLRTNGENPRVMAPAVCGEHTPRIPDATTIWMEVAPSLEAFVAMLGL